MDISRWLEDDFEEIWENALPWEELSDANVMVTGASGLIGSFFVYSLLAYNRKFKSNIHIIALARDRERLKAKFVNYENVTIVAQDVCNPIRWDRPLDYILHMACDVQPKTKALNPVGTAKTIACGMFEICELARKTGAKVIQLSSIDVYGKALDAKPFSEEANVMIDLSDSSYAYHEGKRMAEMICASYATQFGMNYSVLRIGRVYGPTMNTTDSMVLSSFLYLAAGGENLYLKSDGQQQYTYVYVSDVAAALYFLMLEGGRTAYNCGEGEVVEELRFGQVAQLVADINHVVLHKSKMDVSENRIYSGTVYSVMTSEKLMKLGWRKKNDIQRGILKTSKVLRRLRSDANGD